jgi:outer membrane protein assembly factor BamA
VVQILFLFFFAVNPFYSSPLFAEESKREKENQKNFGFLILPIFFYTPETKIAAGVGGLFYFRPSKHLKSRPSNIRTVMIYTQKKQFIFEVNPDIYLKNEEYHLSSTIGISKFPDKFWGVGNRTPEEMEENYTSQITQVNVELQKKVRPALYLGIQYDFENYKITKYEEDGQLRKGDLPGSRGGSAAGVGLKLNWDSRNNIFFPSKGNFTQVSLTLYQRLFGSDYTFSRYRLDLRKYVSPFPSHVLAFQGYFNFLSGNPPFQMLSQIGGQEKMRGYYKGRYRDKNLAVFQMEYRMPVWWKFGLVGFGGVGEVADKIRNFELRNFKYFLGWGVRFALNPEEGVYLRLDFGYAKNSSGIYFTAGEAF